MALFDSLVVVDEWAGGLLAQGLLRVLRELLFATPLGLIPLRLSLAPLVALVSSTVAVSELGDLSPVPYLGSGLLRGSLPPRLSELHPEGAPIPPPGSVGVTVDLGTRAARGYFPHIGCTRGCIGSLLSSNPSGHSKICIFVTPSASL